MKHKQDILCASARVYGSRDYPELYGTVKFTQMCGGVLVTAEIFGLPSDELHQSGIFAFHIHEGNSCEGNEEDPFFAAGGHYNPHGQAHPYHAGDLPSLVSNHGYAYMSVFTTRFTVREIVGHVIIIHGEPDDFVSQPSGNAGPKIACGKICTGKK